MPQSCHLCERTIDDDQLTRLWDHRPYCRMCLASRAPRVAHYFGKHRYLEDTLSIRDGLLLSHFMFMWAPAIISLILIGVMANVGRLGIAVVIAIGCTMPAIHVLCGILTLPQTIRIRDGRVEIKMPWKTRSFHLQDCMWTLDANLEDKAWYPVSRIFWRTPAIVLEAGILGSRLRFYLCISEETRSVWREFLELAVPECIASGVDAV